MPLSVAGGEFSLAEKGRTEYEIVIPEKALPATKKAAEILADTLNRETGADFHIVTQIRKNGKYIFLEKAPDGTGKLSEDEYVYSSKDGNIYLYGEGIHGAFNATITFMEDHLGWRWFSAYDSPVIPRRTTLVLKDFSTTRRFLFPYRARTSSEFVFFHGCNMQLQEWNEFCMKRYGNYEYDSRIISKKFWPVFIHVGYQYLPPFKREDIRGDFLEPWLPKWDYAKDHPEFYAMDSTGSRKPFIHLCWSNRELRKTYMDIIEKQLSMTRDNSIVTVDTGDDAIRGRLCCCPECRKLEKKYDSLVGPVLDFSIELAEHLQRTHPGVIVALDVFRRDPERGDRYTLPKLQGGRLPDNCMPIVPNKEFINRPIEPEFYESLCALRKVVSKLMLWTYPQPFGLTDYIPFSNLGIQVANLKKIKDLVTYEFNETGAKRRLTFNQLSLYVILHLYKNPNADVDQLIREYTNGRYGNAAPLVRKYHAELEDACANWKYGINYDYSIHDFETTFGYLTPERMLRWQMMFDEMTTLAKDNRNVLNAVNYLRISLDYATLALWKKLNAFSPDYFNEASKFAERLNKNRELMGRNPSIDARVDKSVSDMLFRISLLGKEKSLPPQFADFPASDVVRLTPVNAWFQSGHTEIPGIVKDDSAAFGFGCTIAKPDLPFHVGIYHQSTMTRALDLALYEDDLSAGEYKLYKMGETVLTQNTLLWFSSKSWMTQAQLGHYWDSNNTTRIWTCYISLKFPKDYSGKDTDIVLCDQIILIAKRPDKKK